MALETLTVLFRCPGNEGVAAMATGFVQDLAGEQVHSWSPGSKPTTGVNPVATAAMAEVGIDIAGGSAWPPARRGISVDVLITTGWSDPPIVLGNHFQSWELHDPTDQSLAAMRPVRDEIERRVHSLLTSLGVRIESHAHAGVRPDALV